MKEEFLEILREPGTGAVLILSVSELRDGEIWAGVLRSSETGAEYPIRDGIPRFVASGAYTESFGLQWNRFSTVQLDSANGARYSHLRFEQETLWSEGKLRGRWVLDGGCGCGRFAEVAAELGTKVIALDYSSAVDAAARNLAAFPNVHYVQGDLLRPPLKAGSLDFAYSIGVLQHTPDPSDALESILRLLAPGGQFAFTIYARRWYTKLNGKYLVRPLTRHIPSATLLQTVEGAMPVLFPLTSALFSLPVLGKVARFVIPVANYVGKTGFTRDQRYQEAILDTFDMLAPTFDRPMTADEIEHVFHRVGIREYQFLHRVPINVTGSMPQAARSETRGASQLEPIG